MARFVYDATEIVNNVLAQTLTNVLGVSILKPIFFGIKHANALLIHILRKLVAFSVIASAAHVVVRVKESVYLASLPCMHSIIGQELVTALQVTT